MTQRSTSLSTGSQFSLYFEHVFVIARRGIRDLIRMPTALFPSIMIPVFFLLVYSAGIGPLAAAAAGNEDLNYKGFVLATILMLSITNSASSGGFAAVRDIESGYFDKLLLAPVHRSALILGRLMGDGFRASLQGSVVLLAGLAIGTGFAGGILGWVVTVALCVGWAIAYTGIGLTLAIGTGNSDATHLSFFFGFPIVFLSPAFAPREQLGETMRQFASYNPVTYIIEAQRHLILEGTSGAPLLPAVAAILLFGAATLTIATIALQRRTGR